MECLTTRKRTQKVQRKWTLRRKEVDLTKEGTVQRSITFGYEGHSEVSSQQTNYKNFGRGRFDRRVRRQVNPRTCTELPSKTV